MRVQRASLEKKLGKTVASELSLACLLGRLVRFTACLCLCLLSSFASLSRRKACTQRPASFEDGLSDFASSLSGSQGRHWWKKRSRIEAYAEFHWYAIFSQVISPPFKSKMFMKVPTIASRQIIMETRLNEAFVCVVHRRFQFLSFKLHRIT